MSWLLSEQYKSARGYMVRNLEGHRDSLTGEINCTTLAEDTAHWFDKSEWLDDQYHFIWDLALEISEKYA